MSDISYCASSPDEPDVTLVAFKLFEQYLTSRSARAASIEDVSKESFKTAILTRAAHYRAVLSGNPRLAEAIYQIVHR
jgi:hypothetical protein